MLDQLLADRGRSADVGNEACYVLRRWSRRRAENALQNPHATHDRRGVRPVGGHLQDAGHCQTAAAVTVRRQRCTAEFPAFNARNPIVSRQPSVQHRKIRRDKIGQTEVMCQNFRKEQFCLPQHRLLQHVVELRIQQMTGHREIDVAQVQPLADKIADKLL